MNLDVIPNNLKEEVQYLFAYRKFNKPVSEVCPEILSPYDFKRLAREFYLKEYRKETKKERLKCPYYKEYLRLYELGLSVDGNNKERYKNDNSKQATNLKNGLIELIDFLQDNPNANSNSIYTATRLTLMQLNDLVILGKLHKEKIGRKNLYTTNYSLSEVEDIVKEIVK